MSIVPQLEQALFQAASRRSRPTRMRGRRSALAFGLPNGYFPQRHVVAGITALALATGGGAFAVAQIRGTSDNEKDRTERPQARAVPTQVTSSFGVFRRPRRASDELPESAAHGGGYGANPALSRLSTTTASGEKLYLVAGNRSVCLASARGGMGLCGSLQKSPGATVASAGFSACAPGLPSGVYRVYGVISDGVSSVDLVYADGAKTSVPVEGNVWAAELESRSPPPTRVRWSGPDGDHDEASPVPTDAVGGICLK